MDTGNPFRALADPQPMGDEQVELVSGPDPVDVEVDNLGFLGLNRDKRVKLLPEGFSKDSLPRSCSSLFAIANRRGLFAAAGPTSFVIGTTASLREAFTKEGDYTPQLAVPSPISISHIAFNADESHLILGASSGGLAVYSIDALSGSGETKATFEVGTDGAELREVKPNPKIPELVAIVTMGGDVRMLDLNTRAFKTGVDGSPVLKSTVGTVAWSKLGKQIICGMGDGTGWQMTPAGEKKAVLPAPPGLENHFVSSIVWQETHLFITTHTPVPVGGSPNTESFFHMLKRSGSQFQFTKLFDPAPPYGMEERAPPYFFTAQLRQYEPALKDVIIFAGTCSTDIGVVARFTEQNKEVPADTFVVAQFPDDTRRAEIPLSVDMFDTSPIGMALDLSSKESVRRPVGGEEIEESPGPLPILMVLNYEGVLSAWNVIYNDAIAKGEKYNGMVIYESEQPQVQSQAPQSPAPALQAPSSLASPKQAPPAFGKSAFGTNPAVSLFSAAPTSGTTFGQPSFAAPSPTPFMSSTGSGSAFGQTSAFGAKSSPWGGPPSTPTSTPSTTSAFGQASQLGGGSPAPAFGRTSFGQPPQLGAASPAFGQPSQLGGSPAAKAAFGQPSILGASAIAPSFGKPAFGQPTFGSSVSTSGPPATGSTFGSGSGFAAFANKGGFAAAVPATNASEGASIFGSGKTLSGTGDSAFGAGKTSGSGAFGSSSLGSFKLGSVFKAEPSQAEDTSKPDNGGSLGGFGNLLGNALGSGSGSTAPTTGNVFSTSTPRTTSSPFSPTPNKTSPFGSSSSPFAAAAAATNAPTSPFAALNTQESPFASFRTMKPTASAFGQNPFASTPFGAPSTPPKLSSFGLSPARASPSTPQAKITSFSPPEAPLPPDFSELRTGTESPSDEEHNDENVPPAPLPPDAVSRPSYAPGSTTEGTPTSIPNLPSSPENSLPGSPVTKKTPLSPNITTPQKRAEPEMPAPPENDQSDNVDDEQDQEDEYEGRDGDDEEEGDDDDDDDDDDDEGNADDDERREETETPKKAINTFTPLSKKITTPTSTSSIFGETASYSDTFGADGFQKSSPFSKLLMNRDEIVSESDDSDEEESSPDERLPRPAQKGSVFKSAATTKKSTVVTGSKKEAASRASADQKLGGVIFNPKISGPQNVRSLGRKTNVFPSEQVGAKSILPRGEPASISKESQSAPSFDQQFPRPPSLPVLPRQLTPELPPEEDNESIVDFDAEYSDWEDKKIREQLFNGPIKPSNALPEIKKLKEPDVPEDFTEVFDSIYRSGNMMVNKLGQMARGLQSYHMAQRTPVEGVKHESAEDMKPTDDWRLCEIGLITKTIDELLKDVRKINQGKPELEEKRQTAAKGFIKLDTKESEIKRLFAVHNDPAAAARVRSRLLAPEQQLQQRQLRKCFTRVEKALKESESKATMFKAKIADRDRHRAQAKFKPPTAEAVRTTVMKLTAMAETKSKDVDYLEEKLRRMRLGNRSRSIPATPGRLDTPERELETPARRAAGGYGFVPPTPVMALVEEGDVDEIIAEHKKRKETGRKLKGALQRRGGRITGGEA